MGSTGSDTDALSPIALDFFSPLPLAWSPVATSFFSFDSLQPVISTDTTRRALLEIVGNILIDNPLVYSQNDSVFCRDYRVEVQYTSFFVWLNKTSFLVGNVSRELMTRVKNGEGSAMAQPQFATLVEEVDTNATLWAISTPQKQRSEALEFEPLEWFRLQIDLERGLQMRMAVRFNDEKFAADARKGWSTTPESGSLLELLSQNKSITGEGRDAIASLSLSPPQLEELTEAVEEMWPAIEDLFQVTFPSDADSLSQLEAILKRHKEAISDSKGDCRKIVDAINTKDMELVPFVEFTENMAPDALLALEQKYQNEDISKEAVDKCWGNELKEYSKRQRQLHQERNRVTAPQ